jgi:hypothetical protein
MPAGRVNDKYEPRPVVPTLEMINISLTGPTLQNDKC